MACTPPNFLEYAKSVASKGLLSDIEKRTAINRSYYAAFHQAKQIKETLPLPEAQRQIGNSHNKLFNALAECEKFRTDNYMMVRQFAFVANGSLKASRELADYQLDMDIDEKLVTDTIDKTELLLANAAIILAN